MTSSVTAVTPRSKVSHRRFEGVVVHPTHQKTCIVEIVRWKVHPLYHKRIKRTKRFPVHDEHGNVQNIGQTVVVEEYRPLSKTKRWRIVSQ